MLRTFGDGTMFGDIAGEGPLDVVLLHGWARRGRDFAAVQAALARRGRASLALDLPGFGSSPPPSVAGGARYYASLVAPVLAELGRPVLVVGHSFGGRIATVIAAEHPELVTTVILSGTPLLRDRVAVRSPRPYRAIRWLHRRGWLSDERLEAARHKYGSSDYRAATGVIRDVLVATVAEGYEDELARIEVPVALLWGELDTVVPVSVAERANALLRVPDADGRRLRVLAGVGHLVPLEAADSLTDLIVEVAR